MKLKVAKATPVWQSDDGTRTKFSVVSEDGEVYSTWSQAIGKSEKGTEFEVVIEEREFNGYPEKYVKQAGALRDHVNRGLDMRDRDSIERQVALKSAVEFATSREQMKAADILNLADAFDKFLKNGRNG